MQLLSADRAHYCAIGANGGMMLAGIFSKSAECITRLRLSIPCKGLRVSSKRYSPSGETGGQSQARFRIYTKTGDKGVTSTFAGSRLAKNHPIFEALGSTDLLSSTLGHAREFCSEQPHDVLSVQLKKIQCILQDVGSHVATPRTKASLTKQERTAFGGHQVVELEEWIDSLDSQLPPLTNFILPSGGKTATVLHMARAICREAERRVVPLLNEGDIEEEVYKYLNRLSDYLFVAARFAAQSEGNQELVYTRPDKTD